MFDTLSEYQSIFLVCVVISIGLGFGDYYFKYRTNDSLDKNISWIWFACVGLVAGTGIYFAVLI